MNNQTKNKNSTHLNCNPFSKTAIFQNNRFIFQQPEAPKPSTETPKPPEPLPPTPPLPPQVAQNLENTQKQRVELAKNVSPTQPTSTPESPTPAPEPPLQKSTPDQSSSNQESQPPQTPAPVESTDSKQTSNPSESQPNQSQTPNEQPAQSAISDSSTSETQAPQASTEQQSSKNLFEELKKLPLIGPVIADIWDSFEKIGLMDLLRQIPPLAGLIPPKPGTAPVTQPTLPTETTTKSPEPLPPSHSAKVQSLISKYTEAFKNTKITSGQLNLNLDKNYNPAERQALLAICDLMTIPPVQTAEELLLGTINGGGKLIDNPNDNSSLQIGDLVFFKQDLPNNEFQLVNVGIISSTSPEPQIKILLPNQAKVSTEPLSAHKAAIFGFVQPKK